MMKILIVEDEPKVSLFIKNGLEENSYEIDLAFDGLQARKLFSGNKYNLVVLDILIPHENGIELCKRFKTEKPDVPILMLTALGTTDDKVAGFEAGADDYLVKPFDFSELLARIKALTKRFGPAADNSARLVVGTLELDLNKKTAHREGMTIELTAKEFALLEYFMRNAGRVLSRNDIAEKVWDTNFDFNTNVVDVYVNFLRKKIDKGFEKKLITTRVGLGYILEDN